MGNSFKVVTDIADVARLNKEEMSARKPSDRQLDLLLWVERVSM
jgi:hypothetical protein